MLHKLKESVVVVFCAELQPRHLHPMNGVCVIGSRAPVCADVYGFTHAHGNGMLRFVVGAGGRRNAFRL